MPGRLQLVPSMHQNCAKTFIDYAHTPDALERVLEELHRWQIGKIWVVFGCGGERDKAKRPLMGRVARLHADFTVLTSDNPRTENPDEILDDIQESFSVNAKNVFRILDRKEAIQFAINLAKPDDFILVAGKGHETYQIIGDTKVPMADLDLVLQAQTIKVEEVMS